MSPRHKTGQVLYDPHVIASEITSFWQQTMSVGGQPLNECHSYLASFSQSQNIPQMAEMLILSSAVPELWFCSSGGVCVRMRVCSEPLYL